MQHPRRPHGKKETEPEIDPEIEQFIKAHVRYQVEYEKFLLNNRSPLSKMERLNLAFEICTEMKPASTGIYAKRQLDTALNVVEDSFSNIKYSPMGKFNDGRMYPAQEDYRRKTSFEQIATYEHRAHFSHFGYNGSISIVNRKDESLFDKAGEDKVTVGELRELSSPKISSGNS